MLWNTGLNSEWFDVFIVFKILFEWCFVNSILRWLQSININRATRRSVTNTEPMISLITSILGMVRILNWAFFYALFPAPRDGSELMRRRHIYGRARTNNLSQIEPIIDGKECSLFSLETLLLPIFLVCSLARLYNTTPQQSCH